MKKRIISNDVHLDIVNNFVEIFLGIIIGECSKEIQIKTTDGFIRRANTAMSHLSWYPAQLNIN